MGRPISASTRRSHAASKVDFRNVGKLQNCFYQIGGAAGNECQGPAGLRQSHQNSQAAFLSLRSHAQGARGKTSTSTSDFEVLVHPPEETTDEIRESLDATMRAENAKLSMALAEFAKEKQDLANLEKQELRDIVR